MFDIYLNNYFDFNFTDDGDIKTITDDITPSIIIALFANRDNEIVLEPNAGSNLYKVNQSRITTNTLTDIRKYIKQALTYLEDLGIITDSIIDLKVDNTSIIANITLNNYNLNTTQKYTFTI